MHYYQQRQIRFGFGGGYTTQGVKYLLFANGVIYLLPRIISKTFTNHIIDWFGLHPILIFKKFFIWQLVSYMFLHGDFLHILFNMFVLWMFGCEVERKWGSREFLKYYFICGIGAGLFHLIIYPTSIAAVVGASGAIFGIMLAFAMLFPDRPILLLPFFISLKAKYWVIVFGAMALLFGFMDRQGGIAHFAHLGGMVIGFLYLKFGWKLSIFQRNYISRKKKEWELQRMLKFRQQKSKYRQEIDLILDKINEVGYENLTEKEKRTLKKASDFLSNENEN